MKESILKRTLNATEFLPIPFINRLSLLYVENREPSLVKVSGFMEQLLWATEQAGLGSQDFENSRRAVHWNHWLAALQMCHRCLNGCVQWCATSVNKGPGTMGPGPLTQSPAGA